MTMINATAVPPVRMTYARARLWLGISGVGTFVVLAAIALGLNWAGRLPASNSSLLLFVVAYVLIQTPFDWLGGYILPRSFGRPTPGFAGFLLTWLRGVFVHAILLLLCLAAMTVAGRFGVAGVVVAGAIVSAVLLECRVAIATAVASLRKVSDGPTTLASHNPTFTGGIAGFFRPRHVLPEHWKQVLGPAGFELAVRRRELAVATGSWRRGKIVAIAFTLAGLALSATLCGDALGTAAGTIQLALWFTLWSFVGLLILPTISRRGVIEVDAAVAAPADLAENARKLDALGDDEPRRPALIESIFHPLPSVENRLAASPAGRALGAWDAARSTIYISLTGGSLLGRAVHCNAGQPALWVFLPAD